ncbi:unnamed protein product [Coregonus sp. 'balchen']|nr:unnamed protein product [Coregonus sp. 'balchen']
MLSQEIRNQASEYSYKMAKLPENRNRNRYRDVSPYDHSRVKLENSENDYINASLVMVEEAQRTYILSQGPLRNTCGHFWLMIWEQNSKAVIMLNRVIEKGSEKCAQYWPTAEEHQLSYTDTGFVVTLVKEEDKSYYIIRVLELRNTETGRTREIYHFHYTTWPDFGVPESPASFLNFLVKVRESGSLGAEHGPAVVHCSAGIGRSGTFSLVDTCLILMDKRKDPSSVDIQRVLLDMREYRMGLIQTPDQLRFSYRAVLEGAKCIVGDCSAQVGRLLCTGREDCSAQVGRLLCTGRGDCSAQVSLRRPPSTPATAFRQPCPPSQVSLRRPPSTPATAFRQPCPPSQVSLRRPPSTPPRPLDNPAPLQVSLRRPPSTTSHAFRDTLPPRPPSRPSERTNGQPLPVGSLRLWLVQRGRDSGDGPDPDSSSSEKDRAEVTRSGPDPDSSSSEKDRAEVTRSGPDPDSSSSEKDRAEVTRSGPDPDSSSSEKDRAEGQIQTAPSEKDRAEDEVRADPDTPARKDRAEVDESGPDPDSSSSEKTTEVTSRAVQQLQLRDRTGGGLTPGPPDPDAPAQRGRTDGDEVRAQIPTPPREGPDGRDEARPQIPAAPAQEAGLSLRRNREERIASTAQKLHLMKQGLTDTERQRERWLYWRPILLNVGAGAAVALGLMVVWLFSQ